MQPDRSKRLVAALFVVVTGFPLSPMSAQSQTKPAGPQATDKVELQVLNWNESRELIADHRGKVVLVDIWTTTCASCLESFPGFVALHEELGDKGFTCVSVSCDYDGVKDKPPEYYRDQVTEFLQQQDAPFDHILLSVPFVDFLEEIDLKSTPAYLLFDAEGRLVRRFDNDAAESADEEFSMEDVAQAVRELVEKSQ